MKRNERCMKLGLCGLLTLQIGGSLIGFNHHKKDINAAGEIDFPTMQLSDLNIGSQLYFHNRPWVMLANGTALQLSTDNKYDATGAKAEESLVKLEMDTETALTAARISKENQMVIKSDKDKAYKFLAKADYNDISIPGIFWTDLKTETPWWLADTRVEEGLNTTVRSYLNKDNAMDKDILKDIAGTYNGKTIKPTTLQGEEIIENMRTETTSGVGYYEEGRIYQTGQSGSRHGLQLDNKDYDTVTSIPWGGEQYITFYLSPKSDKSYQGTVLMRRERGLAIPALSIVTNIESEEFGYRNPGAYLRPLSDGFEIKSSDWYIVPFETSTRSKLGESFPEYPTESQIIDRYHLPSAIHSISGQSDLEAMTTAAPQWVKDAGNGGFGSDGVRGGQGYLAYVKGSDLLQIYQNGLDSGKLVTRYLSSSDWGYISSTLYESKWTYETPGVELTAPAFAIRPSITLNPTSIVYASKTTDENFTQSITPSKVLKEMPSSSMDGSSAYVMSVKDSAQKVNLDADIAARGNVEIKDGTNISVVKGTKTIRIPVKNTATEPAADSVRYISSVSIDSSGTLKYGKLTRAAQNASNIVELDLYNLMGSDINTAGATKTINLYAEDITTVSEATNYISEPLRLTLTVTDKASVPDNDLSFGEVNLDGKFAEVYYHNKLWSLLGNGKALQSATNDSYNTTGAKAEEALGKLENDDITQLGKAVAEKENHVIIKNDKDLAYSLCKNDDLADVPLGSHSYELPATTSSWWLGDTRYEIGLNTTVRKYQTKDNGWDSDIVKDISGTYNGKTIQPTTLQWEELNEDIKVESITTEGYYVPGAIYKEGADIVEASYGVNLADRDYNNLMGLPYFGEKDIKFHLSPNDNQEYNGTILLKYEYSLNMPELRIRGKLSSNISSRKPGEQMVEVQIGEQVMPEDWYVVYFECTKSMYIRENLPDWPDKNTVLNRYNTLGNIHSKFQFSDQESMNSAAADWLDKAGSDWLSANGERLYTVYVKGSEIINSVYNVQNEDQLSLAKWTPDMYDTLGTKVKEGVWSSTTPENILTAPSFAIRPTITMNPASIGYVSNTEEENFTKSIHVGNTLGSLPDTTWRYDKTYVMSIKDTEQKLMLDKANETKGNVKIVNDNSVSVSSGTQTLKLPVKNTASNALPDSKRYISVLAKDSSNVQKYGKVVVVSQNGSDVVELDLNQLLGGALSTPGTTKDINLYVEDISNTKELSNYISDPLKVNVTVMGDQTIDFSDDTKTKLAGNLTYGESIPISAKVSGSFDPSTAIEFKLNGSEYAEITDSSWNSSTGEITANLKLKKAKAEKDIVLTITKAGSNYYYAAENKSLGGFSISKRKITIEAEALTKDVGDAWETTDLQKLMVSYPTGGSQAESGLAGEDKLPFTVTLQGITDSTTELPAANGKISYDANNKAWGLVLTETEVYSDFAGNYEITLQDYHSDKNRKLRIRELVKEILDADIHMKTESQTIFTGDTLVLQAEADYPIMNDGAPISAEQQELQSRWFLKDENGNVTVLEGGTMVTDDKTGKAVLTYEISATSETGTLSSYQAAVWNRGNNRKSVTKGRSAYVAINMVQDPTVLITYPKQIEMNSKGSEIVNDEVTGNELIKIEGEYMPLGTYQVFSDTSVKLSLNSNANKNKPIYVYQSDGHKYTDIKEPLMILDCSKKEDKFRLRGNIADFGEQGVYSGTMNFLFRYEN